jgi:hypothetical protein
LQKEEGKVEEDFDDVQMALDSSSNALYSSLKSRKTASRASLFKYARSAGKYLFMDPASDPNRDLTICSRSGEPKQKFCQICTEVHCS